MKEYVDVKFWKMFSGFITLLAVSMVFLLAIKVYQDRQVSADTNSASVITSQQ